MTIKICDVVESWLLGSNSNIGYDVVLASSLLFAVFLKEKKNTLQLNSVVDLKNPSHVWAVSSFEKYMTCLPSKQSNKIYSFLRLLHNGSTCGTFWASGQVKEVTQHLMTMSRGGPIWEEIQKRESSCHVFICV